jgi:hypothetical protein
MEQIILRLALTILYRYIRIRIANSHAIGMHTHWTHIIFAMTLLLPLQRCLNWSLDLRTVSLTLDTAP